MGYLSGIVVIGTSWGGLRALKELVGALPESYGIPIVIVQHRHRDSENILAGLLQECTPLTVCEAEDKQPILAGHVFVAPPDYHLLVEHGSLELSTEAPVRYSRPSIDVTFSSAADAYGDRAVGVVLTGANADGAQGLARIVARRGLGFVQDPAEATSPTMPAAAVTAVPEARVMTIAAIAAALGELRGERAMAGDRP
ncbi:MAG: chemotaxis protein CheB [Gemmatimonadaceae bacterium]|nr:chemotaxis protein CheB [Gemmatimonadaceae bacterium]